LIYERARERERVCFFSAKLVAFHFFAMLVPYLFIFTNSVEKKKQQQQKSSILSSTILWYLLRMYFVVALFEL
jgi:hypothetical protein